MAGLCVCVVGGGVETELRNLFKKKKKKKKPRSNSQIAACNVV